MKSLRIAALLLALTLSLCACGKEEDSADAPIYTQAQYDELSARIEEEQAASAELARQKAEADEQIAALEDQVELLQGDADVLKQEKTAAESQYDQLLLDATTGLVEDFSYTGLVSLCQPLGSVYGSVTSGRASIFIPMSETDEAAVSAAWRTFEGFLPDFSLSRALTGCKMFYFKYVDGTGDCVMEIMADYSADGLNPELSLSAGAAYAQTVFGAISVE